MNLLFKQVIKNSLKDWVQLLILTILVILPSILFVACFSVDKRLEQANNFMGAGNFRYDYYYRYNSISKYPNGQTITPWSAITDEKIEYYKKTTSDEKPYSLEYALPTLSIGSIENAVLKQLDSSWFNIDSATFAVTFKSGYSMKNFFNLNNINQDSIHFKNSLIGQLIKKIKNESDIKLIEKYKADINAYFEILAKTPIMFSLLDLLSCFAKINNTIDLNQIINFITDDSSTKWDTKIYSDKTFNLANNDRISSNYLFKTGMKGNLAVLVDNNITPAISTKSNFNYIYRDEKGVESSVYDDPLNFASYQVGAVYVVDKRYGYNFLLEQLLASYLAVLGDLTNFNVTFRNEYYAWDFKNNLKYKVINWQQIFEYNQMKLLDVYKDDTTWNHNDNSYYVVVSPSYRDKFKVAVGDAINFGNDNNKSLYIGAIGSDRDNIYPLIYDQDQIPDNKNEVIIYLNPIAYQNTLKKYFIPSSIKDNSQIFLHHLDRKTSKNQDYKTYQIYLNDDFTKLGNTKSKFTSLNWDNAAFLRNNRLTQVISIYRFINIGLIFFFYLILVFSLIFIIKKIIDKKRIENGILKANGFSSFKIACSYLSYGIFMSVIGSLVGYMVGIFAQIPTINVFNNYFIIPNKLEVGWDSFLINFFIIFIISFSIIFLISYFQVKQHPLLLINPNSKLTSENLVTKLTHKIKVKKFTRKFRLILLSVSIKNIVLLFMVILIATIGITAAALIPTTLFQISNDYFYNLNYKNQISYQGVIHNNPLTRYHTYVWQGPQIAEKNDHYSLNENNVIPNYIYDYEYKNGIRSTNKKWIDVWNIDPKEIRYYQNTIQNAILYNFASTKGATFSLGLFKQLSTRYHSDDLNYSISTLLCSIIPTAFGKNPITFDNSKPFASWDYCISAATESLLPADIKQIWVSNPHRQDQFNFTFGTVAVNKTTDDLYTNYYSNINNKNIETIGITTDNKTIKTLDKTKLFKANTGGIAVAINKYLNKVNNLNKGDLINASVKIPTLQYYSSKSKTYQSIGNNKSFWYCNESDDIDNIDNLIDIEKNPLTLNKITLNNENSSLNVKFGFKNKTNKIQPYYKLSNIELFLPTDEINPTDWDMEIRSDTTNNLLPKLFDVTSSLGKPKIVSRINYQGKQYYVIKIYSSDYDYVINDPLSAFKSAPNTWYHITTSDVILKTAQPFLKINNIKKQVQYEVVQIHPSYDKPRIYMSINNANNILNYSQATVDHLPLWYNGKFSQDMENYDQTAMLNNVPLNGDYNLNNFLTNKYVNAVNSDKVDHIGLKQILLTKLAVISINLTLVFILLMCMAGIIVIFIIIDAFLDSYLKFIVVLKTIGYNKKEVNSMTIAMFTPFIFVAWIIGLFLTWFIIRTVVVYYALKSQVVIPFGLPWYLIPLSFTIVMLIYAIAYFILSNKISRLSIQKQINLIE